MYMVFCVVSADPFAALGSTTTAPAASPAAAPDLLGGLDDDMYGSAAQPSLPQAPPLGYIPAQSQHGNTFGGQMPGMTGPLPQPAAASQTQKSPSTQSKAAPAPGGPAPMAPRGNAAVEQQAGRKDPFADLFS